MAMPAGGLGCGAGPAALRSRERQARCDAPANAYFGEELVLRRAKPLDFPAAIGPA